jgi:23S rRNA (pseudouridine1915-N3)-methyltransferase
MKLELWSIGKKNDAIFSASIDEFSKRIQRYYKFELVILSSKAHAKANIKDTLADEAVQIQSLLSPTDLLICLDENGIQLNTIQFSEQFQSWLMLPYKKIVFLIGSAYGIDSSLKKNAHYRLGLSALTFPHQLVRLVFTEQLYRVCTVLNNEHYHHE